MKNTLKSILLPLVIISFGVISQISASASDLSDWAKIDYENASAAGLLPQSIISSDLSGNITREEFCELVINLYTKITNKKVNVPPNSPFSDTNNASVKMAYMSGIIAGTSENTFHPNKAITRQEMAKMLIETMNVTDVAELEYLLDDFSALEVFRDANDVSSWAKRYMAMMVDNNLMNGLDSGELAPLGNATRQQAIASVSRCYTKYVSAKTEHEVPVVMIPKSNSVISEQSFAVVWQPVEYAERYHMVVKSESGVCLYETTFTQSGAIIDSEMLDGYTRASVTIGAEFSDGTITYSLPVDFTYTYAKEASDAVNGATSNTVRKEESVSLDYSKEGMSASASKILQDGEQFIGLPYVYGGSTPKGFDCSGFTKYVYGLSGITLQRVSRDQYAKDGTHVKKSDLQPGDLVFFGENGRVSHVGIYAGNGKMLHSPRTGKSICYTSIESNYYVSRYIGAKRVLK